MRRRSLLVFRTGEEILERYAARSGRDLSKIDFYVAFSLWKTDLLLEIGAQADALRAQALPRLLEDLSRIPDTPISGPESAPVDHRTRRRFFGEE